MRVYRPKVRAGNQIELPVIACVIRSRTRMTLFPAATSRRGPGRERPGNLTRIVIAGDVAAFVTNSLTGVDTSGSGLTIADVARRSILREAPVGHGVDAGLVFSSGLTALDVTPEGAAAWITRTTRPLPGRAPGASVFAAPRTGPIVTLDEGPGIEPESLFLSGDTVNWVDDGTTRSAPLPSPPAP